MHYFPERRAMDNEDKLRMPAAARRIGVTTEQMYRLIIDGHVPYSREGEFRLPVVAASDLDGYRERITKQ